MSLFSDRWTNSAFDSKPFGRDTFHTSSFPSFGGSRLGSTKSFQDKTEGGLRSFLDESERDFSPFFHPTMRIDKGRSAGGFYDDFDSIFPWDITSPRSKLGDTGKESSSRRHFTETKGKEYVIPIKVESRSAESPSRPKVGASFPSNFERVSDTKSSSNSGQRPTCRVIEIPVVRETLKTSLGNPSVNVSREKSRSPLDLNDRSAAFRTPQNFTLLTPTTEELNGRKQTRGSEDDVIYLDEEDFFPKSRVSSRTGDSETRSSRLHEDDKHRHITRIEIKQNEETVAPLCRKPLRHFPENATSQRSSERGFTSPATSVSSDANRRDDVSTWNGGEAEKENKPPVCHSAVSEVTSPPTYPIYDYLKPRLASIGRQVDYIRGDGNCFFRALSKEMYGTEDFHAEWRQAVCDMITQHPSVFQQYIDGGRVSSHVKDMRKLGTWATTCEIYASATLLQRQVYVLAPTPGQESPSSSSEYHWLLFSPRALSGSSAGQSVSKLNTQGEGSHDDIHPCYLTLCHTNGNHYDRITPVFASCNCQLPPPVLDGVSVLLDLTEEEEEELMQQ